MSSRTWVLILGCVTPIFLLATACSDHGDGESWVGEDDGGSWAGVCIDFDGDGYGMQCDAGVDCDDSDPALHANCPTCTRPEEGCACQAGTASVECAVAPEVTSTGSLLCKEGTRYCRDGVWSACEGIASYTAPPPSGVAVKLQGLVQGDAGRCSACNPDCYEVKDTLQPVGIDGGGLAAESGVAYGTGGGITLSGSGGGDGGTTSSDDLTPIPPCTPTDGGTDASTDNECDGIPNTLDPYPYDPPFASDYSTIFMDIPPGTSKSNTFELNFYLHTADIYFLLDMTGSMGEERDKLISSLTAGNFLDDPSTTTNESLADCADRDFDGTPDNTLKTGGIAGNIACLIRDSAFGAGWYREVPFSATDSYGIRYSYPNFQPYEHRLDITTDVEALSNAFNLFVTRSNRNWAEAGAVALSAVATGGPIYMGWNRPGIPSRTCDSEHFGYPCFRSDAVPVVILITDAPIMNGPNTSTNYLGVDSNSGKNQPPNYESAGLAYTSNSSDSAYHAVSGNESFATAYNVGAIDNSFITYTGNTRGMTADVHAGNLGMTCSSWPSGASSSTSPGYPDAVFKFTVPTTKTLTVSTRGTHFMPTLAVVPVGAAATTTTAASNATPAAAQNLGSLGTSFSKTITGDTDPGAFDTGDLPVSSMSECLRGATTSTTAPDAWFKFTVPSDVSNVKFTVDGGDFDAALALWSSAPTPPVSISTIALGTNDKFNTTAAAPLSGSASSPGAIDGRSVWLTGGSTSASGFNGDYGSSLFSGVDSSCSGVSGTVNDAVVDFQVTGGSKTVRFETTSSSDILSGASFDHVIGLFTRPTSGTTLPTASYCDRNGAGTQRGYLETTLSAGTYSLVVRGESSGGGWGGGGGGWGGGGGGGGGSADTGTYGLLISDASTRPVACTLESSSSSFTSNLKAGVTYYLGMRGRNTSSGGGRGPYTITISSTASSAACAYDNTTYPAQTNDDSYDLGEAEITQTFAAGDYYAVVKGRGDIDSSVPASDTARGWYQITFGDSSLATNNQTASLPVWGTATSGGVRQQLTDRGIRVITVASTIAATCGTSSCSGGGTAANTALLEQGASISSQTGATNTDGSGLVFKIANDGSGMGNAVVSAVNRLAKNLAMDVSVRYVALPDTPSKPFTFQSRAVTTAGNLCSGTSDTNGDGVVDTHLNCSPGATPRFQITFTNPSAPNNVPPNPAAGSNGGYNMRLELIADGQYVIDTIPVFIIPEDVVTGEEFKYDQQGYYSQDVSSNCSGTDRPSWQSLAWNASLPAGTAIDWRICTGDTTAELDSCQSSSGWSIAAHVIPGAACTSSSECANGYCSSGTCHYPTAPGSSCTSASDCGTNGVCALGVCAWTANPISFLPSLKSGRNSKTKMRLQVQLTANAARTAAPTVQDFQVIYVCTPGV